MNHSVICRKLEPEHLNDAVKMAQKNYDAQRAAVPALPHMTESCFRSNLEKLLRNGTGYLAFEDDAPAGFLAFEADASSGAACSPVWGCAICGSNRSKITGMLLQAALAELALHHTHKVRMEVYAYDREVLDSCLMGWFTMDVADVVRSTAIDIPATPAAGCSFQELSKAQFPEFRTCILELYRELINHLRRSPVFYPCNEFLPLEKRFDSFLSGDMRLFAAFSDGKLIGMIDSEPVSGGFEDGNPHAVRMSDVLVLSGYRGQGIGAALLQFANRQLRESGVKTIYVTHGTVNPTAREFWNRYFSAYSYTLERSIDPQMLGVIKSV